MPIPPLSHLGDMPIETFISEYWHKKPLLIRQAFKRFESPISPDELAGMACEEEVESRLIIEDPISGEWELKNGPFDEEVFANLPAEYWTLLVQAVDHWVPEAADFIEQFRFIPSWRLDDLMISYATKGGGVGAHYDNYDVFLLQAQGQRRWEIGGIYDEDSEFVANKPVRILQDWQPQQSWVLEPGDMLYIPPRVGHNGVAESDSCVTYSVGYRAPQSGDMLMGFAADCAKKLKDIDRYADPDLSLRLSSGEICQSDLQRVQSLFKQFVDDPACVADWFGRMMTEPKCPNAVTNEELLASDKPAEATDFAGELAESEGLRRCEGVRFAYWQGVNELYLFVDGQTLSCDSSLLVLVQLLCDHNEYSLAQLQPWQENSQAKELLEQLLANDHLYPLTTAD